MNFNDMYVVTELCILREKGDLVYWVRKCSNKKRTEQRLQNWNQKGRCGVRCIRRESNPELGHGKTQCYRYTTNAHVLQNCFQY